ncbi:MAG TPA: DUF445 family protein [Firmicutes bacterium]|jgi:uncharacterized membrane protein YheB (UPF0754 family)|nr:DUF445 family protein [Bacillota bacterium]
MLYIVMAAMGALIGWGTNMVAIWLLFHPYRPIRLGPWQLQGLLPRRQADIARNVGQAIEKELLTATDLAEQLENPEVCQQLLMMVSKLTEQEVVQRLPKYLPLPLRNYLVNYLTGWTNARSRELVDKLIRSITTNLSQLDIGSLIQCRLNSLPLQELEALSWELAGRELRYIEYAGGVLGGVIGLLQAAVLSLGKTVFF